MWTCPECNRSFRNKSQSHSCLNKGIEELFANTAPQVKEICMSLVKETEALDGIKITSVKNAILFAVKSNFFVLKPQKLHVNIEFLLKEALDEFPIIKTVKVYGNKIAHFVRIQTLEEVDSQLLNWLHQSYYQNINPKQP